MLLKDIFWLNIMSLLVVEIERFPSQGNEFIDKIYDTVKSYFSATALIFVIFIHSLSTVHIFVSQGRRFFPPPTSVVSKPSR